MPTASSIARPRARAADVEICSWIRRGSINWSPIRRYGIQRSHRVLEDHRDAFSVDGARRSRRAVQQIDAVEHGRTTFDATGRLGHQSHEGVTGNRFPRTRFATMPSVAPRSTVKLTPSTAGGSIAGVKEGAETVDCEERHWGERIWETGNVSMQTVGASLLAIPR